MTLVENSSDFICMCDLQGVPFFINRAGKGLPAARKRKLEKAKDELRALYGKD